MTLEIIVSIVLALGVLLTCIPTFSGVTLMFVVTVIYGFLDGFTHLAPWHLAIFGGIAALAMVIDTFSGLLGAKLGGASAKSLFWGFIGLFVGLIIFPPLGAFIGMFLGIFAYEVFRIRNHAQAFKSAASSVVAAMIGVVANVVLAITYFVLFLVIVY